MHEGERLAVEVEADQKIKIEARRRDWKSKKRATNHRPDAEPNGHLRQNFCNCFVTAKWFCD